MGFFWIGGSNSQIPLPGYLLGRLCLPSYLTYQQLRAEQYQKRGDHSTKSYMMQQFGRVRCHGFIVC